MEKLDQRIQLVASKEFNRIVDEWRRKQADLPSRSEAIRRLVQSGLDAEREHPMRAITAIIRPDRYDAVRDALIELGVQGLTVAEVKGFGRQRGRTEFYRGAEYEIHEVPKLKLEIVAPSGMAEAIADAIAETARTGRVGDGVIFEAPVGGARRIRTGEEGEDALS